MSLVPRLPVGVQLTGAARAIERSFAAVLAASGGSISVWLVLLHLKQRGSASQRELAAVIGVQASTLSLHLSEMERQGLIARQRVPEDRRTHAVELTAEGEAVFARMRSAAGAFDSALRRGLSEEDTAQLEQMLGVLVANAAGATGNSEARPRSAPSHGEAKDL
jgi:MarR family transcriptional regulator, transcriptional regulator for hemolysin